MVNKLFSLLINKFIRLFAEEYITKSIEGNNYIPYFGECDQTTHTISRYGTLHIIWFLCTKQVEIEEETCKGWGVGWGSAVAIRQKNKKKQAVRLQANRKSRTSQKLILI